MLRFRWLLFAALVASAFVLIACGDDDDDRDADPSVGPSPAGAPLNDDAYLRVFCSGLTDYQDALMTAPDVDEIRRVVEEYVTSLRLVNPPEDLRAYHQEYISYLQAAAEGDPTSLSVGAPPMPDDDVRDRLASKIPDIDECKYPTFLNPGEDEE
ncbi:MAG: hypothetical protein M0R74_10460 [Dehalococcoidia bacterium]|nr:hypothetical protein [Dehalococcoidia bacterium]